MSFEQDPARRARASQNGEGSGAPFPFLLGLWRQLGLDIAQGRPIRPSREPQLFAALQSEIIPRLMIANRMNSAQLPGGACPGPEISHHLHRHRKRRVPEGADRGGSGQGPRPDGALSVARHGHRLPACESFCLVRRRTRAAVGDGRSQLRRCHHRPQPPARSPAQCVGGKYRRICDDRRRPSEHPDRQRTRRAACLRGAGGGRTFPHEWLVGCD